MAAQSGRSHYPRTNPTTQGYQQGPAIQDTPSAAPRVNQYVNQFGGLSRVPNAYYPRTTNAGGSQINGNSHAFGVFQQNAFNAPNAMSNSGNTGHATLINHHHGHPQAIPGMQAQLPSAPNGPPPTLNGNASNDNNNDNNTTNAQALMPIILANTIPTMINGHQVQVPTPSLRISGHTNVSTRANNPNQTYGNQIAGRPPHNIAPPRNIDISILEICTFFPSYVLIPEVAMRAQQNEWSRKELAKAQFDATNMLANMTDEEFTTASNRIQKQISLCGMAMFNVTAWSLQIPKQRGYTGNQDLTANNWRFKSYYLRSKREETFGHMALRDIYRHVPHTNWPQGEDRMILTQCLEFAYNHQYLDLDTSHYDWIMQFLGLVPDGGRRNADHDLQAVERLKTRLPRS
jgi:hypothetical protein